MGHRRGRRMLVALLVCVAGCVILTADCSPGSASLVLGDSSDTSSPRAFRERFSLESRDVWRSAVWTHPLVRVSVKQQVLQKPSGSDGQSGEGLGSVTFATSCQTDVQKPFERGVALLHSFVYDEAEEQFVEVFKRDPECALALWGEAMSIYSPLWFEPGPDTIKRGQGLIQQARKLKNATQRERDYIGALGAFYEGSEKKDYDSRTRSYAHEMELLARRYPEDREAAIFYALSLLATLPPKESPLANRNKAAEILLPLYTALPNHPGVSHYLIHAYDTPKLAERGLPMARHYAQVAPAAAHAQHMPSHIFILLGLWDEAIRSNLAAEKAAGQDVNRLPLHFLDFISYAYLQVGKEAEVQKIIEQIATRKPQLMPMMHMHASLLLAELPARYALEMKDWTKAASLPLQEDAPQSAKAVTYWARAVGAARGGDLQAARQSLKRFEASQSPADLEDPETRVRDLEAKAWIAQGEGRTEEATGDLQQADRIEESADTTAHDWMGASALEMLADLLLEMNRTKEALWQYEAAMKVTPNRFDALYGAAQSAIRAGRRDAARTFFEKLVENCRESESSRVELQRAREFVR